MSGNINIATGRTLTLNSANSASTSTFDGVISGASSNVIINGRFVFTQNNLYTGTTTVSFAHLFLRNDAPNPASKNIIVSSGNWGNLIIEPSSTNFSAPLSFSGWSLASGVGLTLGKTGNATPVSINSSLNVSDLTLHSNQITLNANITLTGSANFISNSALIVPSPVTLSTGGNFNLYTLSGPFNYDLIFPIPNLTLSVGSIMQLGGSSNNRNITVNNAISIPGQIRLTCGNLILNSNISNSNGQSIIIDCDQLNIPTPVSLSTNGMIQINPRTSGTAFTSLIDLTNLSINTSTLGLSIGNSNNSANGITLGNLTIPGAINLNIGGPININGNVNNTTGNFTVRGVTTVAAGKHIQCAGNFIQNGNITFKSDANGTAAFGPLGGTYTTTSGTVTVERYIPAKRAFRFLTSAVTTTGSSTIRTNWQNNGVNSAGLGTHITGGASNGFDVTASNSPSMFTFTNGAWAEVNNTNVNTLTAGTPYRLMVRGDRTISLSSNTSPATPTTLRATGVLRTGNFTPALNQTANGFSLIGNPYQAPIDIKAILTASTNMISNLVYYWDPTLNARGGYVTRNLTTDVNDVTSNFNQYVQPGQAVFVKNTSTGNPTMTISETHKAVTSGAAGVFRSAASVDDAVGLLRVKLQANINNQWQLTDGALAIFNENYSWNVTDEDATKMGNLDEEVSFMLDGTALAIALQNQASNTSTLPIQINKMRHTDYQWTFDLDNYNGLTPMLWDEQTQTMTAITNNTVIPFSTTTTTATDRFKIVFQETMHVDDFSLNVSLYPNPGKSNQSFYLSGVTEAKVSMQSLLGQEIPLTTHQNGQTMEVKPETVLSTGVYFVRITKAGKTAQVKWIVE